MKKKTSLVIIILILLIVFLVVKIVFFSNDTFYPKEKITGTGDIKIACVGDSITYGLGVSSNRDKSWVSLLAKELGNDYQTINYGLVNRTLLSTGDYPYMNEILAEKFWNSSEDIIIFMLGTNDSKNINWNYNRFEKEYEDLVKRIQKEKSKSKLYIMIPPQIFINNPSKEKPNRNNLENGVIPIINKINDSYKFVKVIDLYTLTKDHKEWFPDGIHPNVVGNKKIAIAVAKAIKDNEE